MIVISTGLVLAAAPAAQSAENPVVGWQNLVTVAALTADTEETAYPAANLANPATYLYWKAADTTEQYLTLEISTVDELDYVAFARHNFGTAAIAVTVEGQTEEGGDWAELVQETILPDDGPAVFRFTPISLFALRVKLATGTAAAEAGVMYAGKLLVLERRIYVGHTPLPYGRRTTIANGESISGNFLGRIKLNEWREAALDLHNITPAFYRASMEPFIAAATTQPFFFAWRPGTYPRECGFAWITNDAAPVNERANGMMQIAIEMRGIV